MLSIQIVCFVAVAPRTLRNGEPAPFFLVNTYSGTDYDTGQYSMINSFISFVPILFGLPVVLGATVRHVPRSMLSTFFVFELVFLSFAQWMNMVIVAINFGVFIVPFNPEISGWLLAVQLVRYTEEIGVYCGMLWILYRWRTAVNGFVHVVSIFYI